jgi:hypothetical protein
MRLVKASDIIRATHHVQQHYNEPPSPTLVISLHSMATSRKLGESIAALRPPQLEMNE